MGLRTQARKAWDGAVDAALLAVSPQRAQVRRHFRRMDADADYRESVLLALRVRGYRAAHESGSKTPWANAVRSADGEILGDLVRLRNRSRELNRDDSIGSGITNTFVNNVIGTGMRPQARTGDPKKNERLEAVWKEREDELSPVDVLSHGEAQRLLFRKVLEDGDVLRKAVYGRDEPVWFETIEADRLATPQTKAGRDGSFRDGVERGRDGRPVRYWIVKAHPGDGIAAVGASEQDFLPIEPEFVRHLKVTERPGQSRGVPLFHAILQDVRDLDLLILASLKRTQIAACLAAFITSPQGAADVLEATATKYGYKMDQALEPGMMFKLYPEETVETLVPNFPTPELVPFVILLARRIGAALGISWQIVLKDFSDSTYSSARSDLLEARRTFEVYQQWFIKKCLAWEWRVVLEEARLRGDVRLNDVSDEELGAVQWTPNGWQWVDPLKEAQAVEIELDIGTTTLRDVAASKGRDWEELLEQRLREEAREAELRKDLKLPARTPRRVPVAPEAEETKPKRMRLLGHEA